jgi:hypothetical protein
MNIDLLVEMIDDYMAQYNCPLHEAIADLEFDGPQGSHGPSKEQLKAINDYFAARRAS